MSHAISDALVVTKRQWLQLIRVPEVLIFSTIQPVMFVLLFRYVFGGSISTGIPGVDYVQLLMPGIFVQTVAFTLAGTAVGLAEDMQKGLIDRFRSLPISRGAVVFGRALGDGLLNIVVLMKAESNALLVPITKFCGAYFWCAALAGGVNRVVVGKVSHYASKPPGRFCLISSCWTAAEMTRPSWLPC